MQWCRAGFDIGSGKLYLHAQVIAPSISTVFLLKCDDEKRVKSSHSRRIGSACWLSDGK